MHKHDHSPAAEKLETLRSMLASALVLAEDIPLQDRVAQGELLDVLALANICVLRLDKEAVRI
ncbi:hypothetical protein [Terricaulis sp.]|uniref:hypothetical protein n=1 Tax=Terricaulis sp. TaxID=2768686 RepID=UPI0037835B11